MNNINSNKKDLSPEQREELLRALKARFEKSLVELPEPKPKKKKKL